jgi:hypothetical protein
MDIQVYRSWEKVKGCNHAEMYYSEICRECAINEQDILGRDIEINGYASYRDLEFEDRECEICCESFEVSKETEELESWKSHKAKLRW